MNYRFLTIKLLFVFLLFFSCEKRSILIISHRGVHHDYGKLMANDCFNFINQRHSFVENTIPSIEEAFLKGAGMVEIDISVTKDKFFVLSHFDDISCHASRDMMISLSSWEEVKKINPGAGVTFDYGKTQPFKGLKNLKIPSLRGVLRKFPDKLFLLNPKFHSFEMGILLGKELTKLKPVNLKKFMYWGSEKTYKGLSKILGYSLTFLPNMEQSIKCEIELKKKGSLG